MGRYRAIGRAAVEEIGTHTPDGLRLIDERRYAGSNGDLADLAHWLDDAGLAAHHREGQHRVGVCLHDFSEVAEIDGPVLVYAQLLTSSAVTTHQGRVPSWKGEKEVLLMRSQDRCIPFGSARREDDLLRARAEDGGHLIACPVDEDPGSATVPVEA